MFHRTFNPGPSQVSDAVKADLVKAGEQNIVGISHRSDACRRIVESAAHGLRRFFNVPQDYHIVFTSSATEAMELTVRNLVERQSFHFTNGHFSELFAKISEAYGKHATVDAAAWGELNDFEAVKTPKNSEIVTLTYNETSTGVTCTNRDVRTLRQQTEGILVVDVTSAAGCVPLEIDQADVWLFSVQKGMGLPSGLGIIFLSPRALERSAKLKHAGIFNFERMAEQSAKHETIQTPNVLGIYLLAEQLKRWNKTGAKAIYESTGAKAKLIGEFIDHHKELNYFVNSPDARSKTAVCIQAEPDVIQKLHQAAKNADLVIGSGYGKLKDFTCRIATFPALTTDDVKHLIKVFEGTLNRA